MSPAKPGQASRAAGWPARPRVWNRRPGGRARFATVMPHQPQWCWGSFPVRWDDGFGEMLHACSVTVVPDGGGRS